MLMILPLCCLSMVVPKIWQLLSVPLRFTSIMLCQSSSEQSSVGTRFVMPAELTRMSIRPNEERTESWRCCRELRSRTSDSMRSVLRPYVSRVSATAPTPSLDREEATTSAPAVARPIEMAFPMPEVPPTTTAHFPERLNINTDGLPTLFWVLLVPLGLLLQLNQTVTEIDYLRP